MKHHFFKALIAAALLISSTAFAQKAQKIILGVSPGPHAEAAYIVQKLAKKEGKLDIKIVEFDDYITPNEALAAKDLDANSFQHKPFLDNQAEQNGWDFSIIGYNFLFPMALYSSSIKDISELKKGDTVIIQNDPTNGGRALLLLESYGVIELDDAAGLVPSPLDVTKNEKELKFVEIAAPETINYIRDAALVSINTDFVTLSDEIGSDNIVIKETPDSPYTNIIVVRSEDKGASWTEELLKFYHSDEVKNAIMESYGDDIVLAW